MELPHFTLFWRRLLRKSGRGQVGIAFFWLYASLVQVIPLKGHFLSLGNFSLGQFTIYATSLIGHFLLYRVISSTMQLEVSESKDGALVWFNTPLDSRNVLLSALLGTCLLSVVPLAGLFMFQSFAMHLPDLTDWTVTSQLAPSKFNWLIQNMLMIPGLVSFALACVALQLPFRNFRYRFLLPDAIAVAAACISFWEGVAVYESSTPFSLSTSPLLPTISFAIVIIFLLFLVLREAVIDPTAGKLSVLVFFFIAVPVFFGIFGGTSSIIGPWHMWNKNSSLVYSDKLSPVHAAYSTIFPGLKIAWADGRYYQVDSYRFLGTKAQHAMVYLAIIRLLLCLVWWKFVVWQINTSRRGE